MAPLVTLFHKPTLKQTILQATMDRGCLDRKKEALVFSVYFAAIASMTEAQCILLLEEDQTSCLQRYRFAAEQAIARAGFPQVCDLVVLQAMVLFLICLRRHENTFFVSAMMALVLRLGRELNLNRDGTNLGLSPFETEMRRRLWWHIYLLEIHCSAEQGTNSQIYQGDYDTQLPSNIHDEDISSNSETFPHERQTFTAITVCVIRAETAISLRQLKLQNRQNEFTLQQPSFTTKEQVHMLDELRQRLEEKYFAFCDLNDPIQWVSVTICRLAISRAWLTISLSTVDENFTELSLPEEERDRLFLTSSEIVEFAHLLEVNEKTAHWGWFFNTYIQWLAFSFLLSELTKRPPDSVTDRAWTIAEYVYNRWNREGPQRKTVAWSSLSQLMTRVSEFRNQPLR